MTSRVLTGALALTTSFGVSAQGAVPPDLEAIDPTYRNCRGINYLATYPSLNGSDGYRGVASSTAMWFYYDTSPGGTWVAVDRQLGWLRKSGFNTVRVFLSFPAWEYFDNNPLLNRIPGKNDAVRRYEHFLALCKNHGIWCTPVLWDETLAVGAPEPVPGTVFGNLGGWHTNPGEARMQEFLNLDPTLVNTPAGRYLTDYVGSSGSDTSFLFWHLMNEPAAPDQLATDFLTATLGILDTLAPEQPTLLLAALALVNAQLSQLARDPRVDLLGIHPYGSTRGAIEAQVYDVTNFPDPTQPSGFVRKPIVATEIGSPGVGWAYSDAVRYALGVPRPDLGPNEVGVGYMPWVSCIGWKGGNFPLKENSGMFYGDGEVRDIGEVMAFVDAAKSQGINPATLWQPHELVEKSPTSSDPEDFIAQEPIPRDLDSYADLVYYVTADPTTFDFDEYCRAANILANTGHITAYLAGRTNGNPYGIVGVPYRAEVPIQNLLLLFVPNIAVPGSENWHAITATSRTFCDSPFSKTSPCHLRFLASQVMQPWQSLLAPYVLGQGGPY